jgi:hypothetical protein
MHSLLNHSCEGSADLAFGTGAQDSELQSDNAGPCLNVSHLDFGSRRISMDENGNHLAVALTASSQALQPSRLFL